MMRLAALISFVIPFVLASCKYNDVLKETVKHELTFQNLDRHYLVHTPRAYDSLQKSYPLIIVYHGIYSRAKAIAGFSDFNRVADQKDFIVCYPQGYNREWKITKKSEEVEKDDPNEKGFLLKMMDELEANYRIDSEKIFHCGISNGAYMTMIMSNNYPEKFDGMAVVCGNMAVPFEEYYSNIQAMPVLFFGGTEDKLIRYDGGPYKDVVNSLGFDKAVQFWCDKNQIEQLTDSLVIDNDLKDKTKVVRYYNPENQNKPVELYKMVGAGHGWPGRGRDLKTIYLGRVSNEIQTAEVIADFFLGLTDD